MVSCYVYYRVAPDRQPDADTAVRATIEQIRLRTGIAGRLMTKVDEPLLWMEVYEAIADETAFLAVMERCARHNAISRFLDGDRRRHTEIFQPAPLRQENTMDKATS